MYKIALNWLCDSKAQTGGCFALNQTLKRHSQPEIVKEYVKTIFAFTQSEDPTVEYFTQTLSKYHSEDLDQYFQVLGDL